MHSEQTRQREEERVIGVAIVASGEVQIPWQQLRDSQRRLAKERRREKDNWRRYDATEFGQWNETALAQLADEGRAPHTFNFSKRSVDVIVGSVVTDTQDVHFETEFGEKNHHSIIMEMLYKEDFEIGNYLSEFTEFIRAGFVYRGWLEYFKNRSNDPRGRVGIRYIAPDRIVVDPDWNTKKVDDNKQIFITTWMTAEQIKERYHKTSAEIEAAIQMRDQVLSASGSTQETDKVFDLSPESYDQQNGLFLVFNKIWLKKTVKQKIFDIDKSEMLPDMEGEDLDLFVQGSKVLGRNVQVIEDMSTVCMVKTLVPGLSLNLVLEEGKHPIQTGGYPLLAFSADSINGRPNTPMDQLKDVQEALNKRESTITHILMTQSNNTLLFETDAVENSDQIQEIGKKTKRPGATVEVTSGSNSLNKIKYLDRGTPPHDFLNSANHMRDMAHDLTPAVPAIQAAGESGESGVLYQAKVAQAQVGMVIPNKNIKAVWNDLGNGYFRAVRNIMTYPFTLSSPEGEWKINMPGGVYLEEIPRLRVTITTAPTSETYRRQLLQQYIAINQYLPSPLAKLRLARYVMSMLPNVPDSQLKDMDAIFKLEMDVETAKKVVELMGLNNQAQMAAMGPQMPQLPGMPPGGGGQGPKGLPGPAQGLVPSMIGGGDMQPPKPPGPSPF